jgi:hypothetical protein
MSGVQTQVGTGNGTRAGRPAIKAKNKRTRRTKAQIAAAQGAQPAAAIEVTAAKLPADAMLAFCDQTRERLAKLSPPQQIAAKAWMKATYAA